MRTPGSVVLIAYHFPPAVGIASERMASFQRHLPEYGWDCHVVAPQDPHFHRDSTRTAARSKTVHSTRSIELSRVFRRAYRSIQGPIESLEGEGGLSAVRGGKWTGGLRRLVREFLYIPDAQVGWVPFAARAGTRVLGAGLVSPRVVMSSSVPYSSHLIAWYLAGRFRIPWVAEFRDPWTLQDQALLPKAGVRRAIDRRLETWIVNSASHLVVTSEATRSLYLDAYSSLRDDQVSVVLNGFEPRPPGRVPAPRESMTLVHAGAVQSTEYLLPLLASAARINGSAATLDAPIRLIAYGDRAPWISALAELELREADWVELRGVVEPAEAAGGMAAASALLLLYPHPRFSKVIAGKLFAYLGARRPIVGSVPGDSEMAHLVRTAGQGWLVADWEVSGVTATLETLLRRHRAGELQAPTVAEETVRSFTSAAQTQKLAGVLELATRTTA